MRSKFLHGLELRYPFVVCCVFIEPPRMIRVPLGFFDLYLLRHQLVRLQRFDSFLSLTLANTDKHRVVVAGTRGLLGRYTGPSRLDRRLERYNFGAALVDRFYHLRYSCKPRPDWDPLDQHSCTVQFRSWDKMLLGNYWEWILRKIHHRWSLLLVDIHR